MPKTEPTPEQIAFFLRAQESHRRFVKSVARPINTTAEDMFRRQNPGR